MDILLNDDHDIVFDNQDNPPVTDEKRLDVAQRLLIKLKTFLGEWFLNTQNGVPYDTVVFGKNKRKGTIDVLFQSLIMEDEDVLEITKFDSTLDNASRHYSLAFRVRVESGVTDDIII